MAASSDVASAYPPMGKQPDGNAPTASRNHASEKPGTNFSQPSLHVHFHLPEVVGIVGGAVARHALKRLPYHEVEPSILIGGDVAPRERGLGQVIHISFPLRVQLVETVYAVSQHLYVRESLVRIIQSVLHQYLKI